MGTTRLEAMGVAQGAMVLPQVAVEGEDMEAVAADMEVAAAMGRKQAILVDQADMAAIAMVKILFFFFLSNIRARGENSG